jgi:hypothetical protein
MKYAKFQTIEQAEAYKIKLQAHHDHDETHKSGPRIVDCVLPTYDGQFALTLIDDDYPATTGEIVDSVNPPAIEGEI